MEKRCQKWCLNVGYVRLWKGNNFAGFKKCSWFSESEMLYCKKGVAAHRVVYLPDWLKPTCLGKVQGRLIYFRLLLKSSIKRIHNLIHPVLEMAVDFWYYTKKCKKMSTVCQTTKTLTVENSENPWIKTFMKQIIWKGITFITVKSQIVSIFADKWRYYCDSFIFL